MVIRKYKTERGNTYYQGDWKPFGFEMRQYPVFVAVDKKEPKLLKKVKVIMEPTLKKDKSRYKPLFGYSAPVFPSLQKLKRK